MRAVSPPTAFVRELVQARVPATSANLGPGFDALGLALAIYDDVTARVTDTPGLRIDVTGEGAPEVPRDESHLVVRAMRAGFDRLGAEPVGLELSCVNRIPHGRGLGSSAAAIVSGLVLARALVPAGQAEFGDAELLALAARIEGHPDNVAACLLGGLTIAWTPEAADQDRANQDGAAHDRSDRDGARAVRLEPGADMRPVVFIPATSASTELARAALPEGVPHADAAFNAARAALLVAALTGRPALLLPATQDRLHQPYRAGSMPESAALVAALRAGGFPAVVSGAGPSVLAFATAESQLTTLFGLRPEGWGVTRAEIDRAGATLSVGSPPA